MNGHESRSVFSLGLRDLSPKDRAETWKPFLVSFLVVTGLLAGGMTFIWWLTG